MAKIKAMSSENFPALAKVQQRQFPTAGVSPSYRSYADVASGRAAALMGDVSPYLSMIIDPLDKAKAARYPDETIVPTGLVHLVDQQTYTIAAGTSTVMTALRWKCSLDDPATPVDTAPIVTPQAIGVAPVITDYGAPQVTWANLSSIDRSLAVGIKCRVVALPVGTYLPSGTLYFIQGQANEGLAPFSTEQGCIQAVTAGKGFSATVNELSKTDGVTLPYLPQGPMSFVFSDTNADAPVVAGSPAYAPTVVSANGFITVVGFGLQPGLSLRFDYAHHIEYIPRAVAAGLISTAVQPPSASTRDAISRGAQTIQQTIAGSTSLGNIAKVVTGGGSGFLGSLTRAAVGMIPGGTAMATAAKTAAESLGAPAWLKTALGFLA